MSVSEGVGKSGAGKLGGGEVRCGAASSNWSPMITTLPETMLFGFDAAGFRPELEIDSGGTNAGGFGGFGRPTDGGLKVSLEKSGA